MSQSGDTPRVPYNRGLMTSIVNNGSAYGFSVMITTTFGMLTHFHSNPTVFEIVQFALCAVLAVSAIETVASRGFRRRPNIHPDNVILLGTAGNLVSVGITLGIVYVAGLTLPAVAVWVVAPLLAAGIYVVIEAAELMVAERVEARVFTEREAEPGSPG